MSNSVRDLVLRYYDVAGDLASTAEQIEPLLAPDIRVVEHPNALIPNGAARGRAEIVAALGSGRALLNAQRFEVHEILELGGRAAVRATWTGTVGVTRGPLVAGMQLRAEVASFLSVENGRIVEQETFDCYSPFPG